MTGLDSVLPQQKLSCASGGIAIWAAGRLKDGRVDLSRVFEVSAAAILVAAVLLLAVRAKHPGCRDSRIKRICRIPRFHTMKIFVS